MIKRDVRLPQSLYDKLVSEANESGIGQPAVVARSIIVKRLSLGNVEPLAEILRNNKPSTPVIAPRISIRISDMFVETLDAAAQTVSNGEFSGLVQAILMEHYGVPPKNQ